MTYQFYRHLMNLPFFFSTSAIIVYVYRYQTNKIEKTQSQTGRGRGRGQNRGSRQGLRRGQGQRRGRGGTRQYWNSSLQQNSSFKRSRGRGRGAGGRARGRGQGRGIRRGGQNNSRPRFQRQNSGISPLNRSEIDLVEATGNTSPTRRRNFKEQRQQALQALQQARKRLANIDARRRQQTGRQTLVNQRRGLQENQNLSSMRQQSSKTRARRWFGGSRRGLNRNFSSTLSLISPSSIRSQRQRGGLNRNFSSTLSLASQGSNRAQNQGQRKLNRNFGVYSSTLSLASTGSSRGRGRGRGRGRWRTNRQQDWSSQIEDDPTTLTVSVFNESASVSSSLEPEEPMTDHIASLKPAVSTKYKFNRRLFQTAGTSVSLNDRFTGVQGGNQGISGSRKVFL